MLPIVIDPAPAVKAFAVLFFVPLNIESASIVHPPIFPLTTFKVRASILPAVINDVFKEATSIRAALIVPAVIWVAFMVIALIVLADSFPVKIPVPSI